MNRSATNKENQINNNDSNKLWDNSDVTKGVKD